MSWTVSLRKNKVICPVHTVQQKRQDTIGGTTIFNLWFSTFHKYTIKLGEVYLFPVYENEITIFF